MNSEQVQGSQTSVHTEIFILKCSFTDAQGQMFQLMLIREMFMYKYPYTNLHDQMFVTKCSYTNIHIQMFVNK